MLLDGAFTPAATRPTLRLECESAEGQNSSVPGMSLVAGCARCGFFCVSLGIAIISASAPDFFTEDTPTAVLVRQVLGAIAQFEKASSVAKLAAARKRKREREGRCEGRKPLRETHPEAVALARKLRRRRPKGGQLSLREVSKELATRGFLNERGKPYAAKSVASMLR